MSELMDAVFAEALSPTGRPKLYCSFCGRDESQVSHLVAGNSAHICDSCIADCAAVVDQRGGFDRPGPTQSH